MAGPAAPRGVLARTLATLALVYVGLRFGLPWLSVAVGLSQVPAPVPVFALRAYMVCAGVGAAVYVTSDRKRWLSFLGPVVRLAAAPLRPLGPRALWLALPPLLAGWLAWRAVVSTAGVPAVIRVQHPGLPERYAALRSPLAALDSAARAEAIAEGTVLYQKNCRPCHGAKADGDGPLARGLRLRPVDFTDPGTIATVVESYPYWRIEEGAAGLPDLATPWNSAMPAWGEELTSDEIWRLIAAEHRLAGTEPRRPERDR